MKRHVTAVAAGMVALGVSACSGPTVNGTGALGAPKRTLSHVAVQQFIADRLSVADVVCNGGDDVPLTGAGQTFTCTAAGGKRFTITVTDVANGTYTVS